jgi:hypothetical protein
MEKKKKLIIDRRYQHKQETEVRIIHCPVPLSRLNIGQQWFSFPKDEFITI